MRLVNFDCFKEFFVDLSLEDIFTLILFKIYLGLRILIKMKFLHNIDMNI